MSEASSSPETRAKRHKHYVLVGYAAVVWAVLIIATTRGVRTDETPLVLLILAASQAVFGAADRLP